MGIEEARLLRRSIRCDEDAPPNDALLRSYPRANHAFRQLGRRYQ